MFWVAVFPFWRWHFWSLSLSVQRHKTSSFPSTFSSVQFSRSVVSNSCNPVNRSMPGLPVHHQLPEFTQTHVCQVGDAIQPSHPLSSSSLPAPNPSQHQGLFQWVNSSHEVAKVLEFQSQHQSFHLRLYKWTSQSLPESFHGKLSVWGWLPPSHLGLHMSSVPFFIHIPFPVLNFHHLSSTVHEYLQIWLLKFQGFLTLVSQGLAFSLVHTELSVNPLIHAMCEQYNKYWFISCNKGNRNFSQ